jgi:hypothetical protein
MSKVKLALDFQVSLNDVRKAFVALDIDLPNDKQIKDFLCNQKSKSTIDFEEMGKDGSDMAMAIVGLAIASNVTKIEQYELMDNPPIFTSFQKFLKQIQEKHDGKEK